MKKKIGLWIGAGGCLLIGCIILLFYHSYAQREQCQYRSEVWSAEGDAAQISCFFSQESGITVEQLQQARYTIQNKLKENSIAVDSENETARLLIDTFSAPGQITLTREKQTVTVKALGVEGAFFWFHPLDFLSGSGFMEDSVNEDFIVIDEITAWQLFGSNDIQGQIIYAGNIPLIISGVVRRPEGELYERAGLSKPLCYMPYETLKKLGMVRSINHYEMIIPNPVDGFALGLMKDSFALDEMDLNIIENSKRFHWIELLKKIPSFYSVAMNEKAIIYPYWENIARGQEVILMVILIIGLLAFVYPAVLLLVTVVPVVSFWISRDGRARIFKGARSKFQLLRSLRNNNK